MGAINETPIFRDSVHEELREIRAEYWPLLAGKERLAAAYAAGHLDVAGDYNDSMKALDGLSARQGALINPVIDAAIETEDVPRLEALIDELGPTLGGGFVVFRLLMCVRAFSG